MGKGMLWVVGCLSIVAVLAMPAYAEVQNIKVDGQINIYGFYRDNYMTTGSGGGLSLGGSEFSDTNARDWYMTSTLVGVTADLTDNVMGRVVMLNERDWRSTTASTQDNFGVEIENAYVTMKEVLYSPLTLNIGRMPVQIADGLCMGDGTTNETHVLASDYSAKTAFDTVHGVLDYDPLTVVLGTVKFVDAAQSSTDDIDGYLLDVIYKMEDWNAVWDNYITNCHYSSATTATGPSGASTKALDVYVLASYLKLQPKDSVMADFGLAYQFGDYEKTAAGDRNLKAWAINVGVDYAPDMESQPKIGLNYVYRSGNKSTTGDYKGWLALYENQLNGIIYDPNTNTNSIGLSGSIMPLDRLTLGLDVWMYRLAKKQAAAVNTTEKKDAGWEFDVTGKYAYTEDVTFGMEMAFFMPGDYYSSGYDKTARQLMASVGVRF